LLQKGCESGSEGQKFKINFGGMADQDVVAVVPPPAESEVKSGAVAAVDNEDESESGGMKLVRYKRLPFTIDQSGTTIVDYAEAIAYEDVDEEEMEAEV